MSKYDDREPGLGILAFVFAGVIVLIAVLCVFAARERSECEAEGGVLLRGYPGYICIRAEVVK